MRILALDSSGLVASVAVVEKIEEEEQVIAEYTVNYKKTHSQTLLPMLDTVSDMIELDLKMIDAIAVAGGPGSFTGLRIGSATAKGLGLAMNKPLIHIPTLEGLAYNLCGTDAIVCAQSWMRAADRSTPEFTSFVEMNWLSWKIRWRSASKN